MVLEPRAAFGHYAGTDHLSRHDGVWTAHSGPLRWRWTGGRDARVPRAAPACPARSSRWTWNPEGGFHDLVLELSDAPLPREPPDPEALWQATESAWKRGGPTPPDTIAPREADHA